MLYMKSIVDVADNTGARKASVIGVLNAKGKQRAEIGDIVRVNIKESAPEAAVPVFSVSMPDVPEVPPPAPVVREMAPPAPVAPP